MATKDGEKTGGRQKGTTNKRTWEARKIIEDLGFDPVTALVHWARGDWEALGLDGKQKEIAIGDGKTLWVDRIDEQLMKSATKDLMPYLFPQLKAVEHSNPDGTLAVANLTQMLALASAQKGKDASGSGTPDAGTDS